MEKQEKAYKGVIEYFKNRIMAGELRPGEKLPPEREIAQMLEVSRNSVREALRNKDNAAGKDALDRHFRMIDEILEKHEKTHSM